MQWGGYTRTTVFAVREDSGGTIWFCTRGGLYRCAPGSVPQFEAIVSDCEVFSVVEDSDAALWAATGKGVLRAAPGGAFEPVPLNGRGPGTGVRAIMCDSGNLIWAGTADGTVFRFEPQSGEFHPVVLPEHISASISDIMEDREHNIWCATLGDGLWQMNTRSGELRHWHTRGGGLPNDLARSLAEDGSGNIWVATEKGLARIAPSGRASFILSDPSSPKALNDNAAYSVYCDDGDNLWVGTFFGGVNLMYSGDRLFDSILSSAQEYSADSKVVSAIWPCPEGLMVGTENDGMFVVSVDGSEISHTWTGNSGISGDNMHSLLRDRRGNLWVGTYCNGLSMKPFHGGSFRKFTTANSVLTSDNIYVVSEDSRGNLWVGTQYGGLYRYDYRSSRLERFPEDLPAGVFVWDIHEGRDGNIWLATFGSGLWKLSVSDGYHAVKADTPASHYINICELKDGRYLLGTEKEGLVEFNPQTLESRLIGRADGLPDDTVYGILQDEGGTVWMSSNSGIIRTDSGCGNFVSYTMSDGLPTNRFNYNACRKIGGILYFGSTNGVVMIRPELIATQTASAGGIRFNGIWPDGRRLSAGETELRIPFRDNTFSIQFSDNLYTLPARKYAYRMQGLNSNWIDIGRGRRIDFLSVPPGHYTLYVAPTAEGVLEEQASALQIRILPPWWAGVPAKIAYILLAAALLGVLLSAILRNTKKRHTQALEKLAREKDEEINEIKRQLLLNESADGQIIRKAADYIYAHSQDSSLGVDALCSAVGISKTSLYRKMKAVTGLSAVEFISNVRLENATRMLAETDHTVSEIAYEVGFTDPYYFSRVFKKVYGCSPKNWREQNQHKHKTNTKQL